MATCNCSDVSGNAGPCPVHAAAQTLQFDDWWQADGKFFDPDTEDVPWFDKRKDLAEYAWHRGRALEWSAFSAACVADILTNVCQIIDVIKQEWGEAWSDWDQSVRDAISKWLKQYHGM